MTLAPIGMKVRFLGMGSEAAIACAEQTAPIRNTAVCGTEAMHYHLHLHSIHERWVDYGAMRRVWRVSMHLQLNCNCHANAKRWISSCVDLSNSFV